MNMFSDWDDVPEDDYGTSLFKHWNEKPDPEFGSFKPVKSEEDEKD